MSGPRLSIIPARACTDPALKPRDLQVLCVLGRHTDDMGWCRKSQVKMADEMGCGRATVFDAIERLIAAGYLERYVHEEANGRDSPHSFRVILDVKEPSAATSSASTPAGIPAPPAGSGPAPKNDCSRTIERDARATVEETAGQAEDPKKVEAEGWALLKNWPGFDGMPKEPALAFWRTMSAEDRAMARRRFQPWLELLRKQHKSHVPAPTSYLRQRLFEAVADPAQAPPPPQIAAPFGKLWNAIRIADLLAGPGPIPAPRGFVATLIDAGGAMGEAERLRHQALHGWPSVNRMDDLAAHRRGWTLPDLQPALEELAGDFVQIKVGSVEWEDWQAEFGRRGWPWLPDPGQHGWTYWPQGGPERLGAFAADLTTMDEGKGNDAGRAEAAE